MAKPADPRTPAARPSLKLQLRAWLSPLENTGAVPTPNGPFVAARRAGQKPRQSAPGSDAHRRCLYHPNVVGRAKPARARKPLNPEKP